MSETLLTVEQTALRLQLSPLTVQRQLKRGALRGIKRGRLWRVPESALLESSPPLKKAPSIDGTPATRAAAIVNSLQSDDMNRRNAAILRLARADAQTRALVEKASSRAVANYRGEDADFSDWRALDGEPFQFPDEVA